MNRLSSDIESCVFNLLEELLNKPKQEIRLSDRLIKDLKLDSDVLTFEFGIPLMQRLGIDVPDLAWLDVYTVEDVINILKKYQQIRH